MTKERPRETGTRFDDRDHEFITSTISYRTGRQEVLLPIDYSHYSFLEKQMIKLRIIFPKETTNCTCRISSCNLDSLKILHVLITPNCERNHVITC